MSDDAPTLKDRLQALVRRDLPHLSESQAATAAGMLAALGRRATGSRATAREVVDDARRTGAAIRRLGSPEGGPSR